MEITPIMQGGTPGTDLGAANIGHTASPSKLERAKAIAQGISVSPSDTPTDPALQRAQQTVRRIKMNTNATTNRPLETVEEQAPSVPESTIPPTSDTTPVAEETAPLSPQFAALARQRRALQVKEREIADREKALAAQPTSNGVEELTARIKSQPLSVLQELGISYDQLTQDILANPGVSPEIQQLKAELKALKEGVDNTLSQRDQQQEQQVLTEIRRETERLASEGETFEMVRTTKSYPDVVELIHRTYKETGEILDTSEAMQLVEDELIKDALSLVNTSKVKSRLASTTQQQQQPLQTRPPIKTLTNRDTARPVLDRRSRAIAAALGQLKR
jgi:hypothetical protein